MNPLESVVLTSEERLSVINALGTLLQIVSSVGIRLFPESAAVVETGFKILWPQDQPLPFKLSQVPPDAANPGIIVPPHEQWEAANG